MAAPRRTTTEQGLGWEHRQRRAALLPLAYGKACPLCGELMLRSQHLDLDHSVPRVLGGQHGDRICHRHCNRSAGATLGNRLRQGITPLDW
jgi:5-methylcytosine-specific restriction endonuclease McrA